MIVSIRTTMVAISVCLVSSAAQAELLISQYKFDGDLANAITDPVGTTQITPGPDGMFREGDSSETAVGGVASYGSGVDGTPGGALRLDGVDDWVDLTTLGQPGESVPNTFNSGPGLYSGTVMAWVRLDQPLAGDSRWLMGSKNANDNQGWQAGWNNSRIEATVSTAGDGEDFILADSTDNQTLGDGSWHHIAYSWDGIFPDGEVYLDGAPLGLAAQDPAPNLNSTNQTAWEFPMAIGARDHGGTLDGFWSGLVDDLRIYADTISDSTIASIFNETTIAENLPPADFDDSLLVDGNDFLIWQRNFGVGTTFAEGNANAVTGDTNIDGTDLALWAYGYGAVIAPPAAQASAVPEPASAALLLLAACTSALRRFRAQAASRRN